MKRREFLAVLAAGFAAAGPAAASDIVDDIVRQLKNQGFKDVSQERTLLGRVRILAMRQDGEREIIVNPRTGEILRDLWSPVVGGKRKSQIIKESSGNGGSGGSDGDDDDGGDDDDDGDDHGGGDDDGDDDDGDED